MMMLVERALSPCGKTVARRLPECGETGTERDSRGTAGREEVSRCG